MVSRPAVHRCSKPTRPDKARKVGYKARAKQPTNGWGVWGGGFRVGFDSNSKDVLVLKLMCFFFEKMMLWMLWLLWDPLKKMKIV